MWIWPWKSTTIWKTVVPFGWWLKNLLKSWWNSETNQKMVVGLPGMTNYTTWKPPYLLSNSHGKVSINPLWKNSTEVSNIVDCKSDKSSWWLNQPIWKILAKMGSSSPNRDENNKYMKPSPSKLKWNNHNATVPVGYIVSTPNDELKGGCPRR